MNFFVSVSGGLDSTALSIITAHENKEAQYIYADTGDEFPQVFEHLDRMESILGIKIMRVKYKMTLGEYEVERKFFPAPKKRFCTRIFKIKAIENHLKDEKPYQIAIGLRADEKRKGNNKKYAVYPLREYGIKKCDVLTICQSFKLVPEYPWYMSRGGCYSCFYKSKNELLALAKYEPRLFNNLIEREEAVQDNRKKYYKMFDRFNIPLRRVKEIADSQEQITMFDNMSMTYESSDCGIYCRK